MNSYNKSAYLILAFIGLAFQVGAQVEHLQANGLEKIVKIKGTLISDEGCLLQYTPIANATIEIFINGDRHDSIGSDTNGNFTYFLQTVYIKGKTIQLKITKGIGLPFIQDVKIPEGRKNIDLAIQMPVITQMYMPFILNCFMPYDVPWYLKDVHHIKLDASRNLVWDTNNTSYSKSMRAKP